MSRTGEWTDEMTTFFAGDARKRRAGSAGAHAVRNAAKHLDWSWLSPGDIEACLATVLKALRKCDLPAAELIAWCAEMLRRDRVGFLCDQALRALRQQFEASRSPCPVAGSQVDVES